MSNRTIAIIGASGKIGSAFSKGLAKSNYRLLLFDYDTKNLKLLAEEIKRSSPSADVEYMNCATEASWEADIIIPDIPAGGEKELAKKIEPFTNRKIVMRFLSANETETLQSLLPGASVAKIFNPAGAVGLNDFPSEPAELQIMTDDVETGEICSEILRVAGYHPVILKNSYNNLNIYQSKINTMETTKWSIDAIHSEIHFKVRHLLVSWVTGSFKNFDATVETEGEDISTAKVRFTADINSISTNNDQRDAHLKTNDFFDAENHPQLIFQSDSFEKTGVENYKLKGTLTIRGISKKIILNVEYGGITKDPWGNTRTGFSLTGKINRKDFGVNFSMVSETGGILLGEDVNINANVEFVKQVAVAAKAA